MAEATKATSKECQGVAKQGQAYPQYEGPPNPLMEGSSV